MRRIVHVDMDAFYASVEQRDRPELRGRPIVVGGSPESRAVVCTASYEARRFGVHSAMPCSKARRLCPEAVFVSPRFEAYREVSRTLRGIFREYAGLVEPLSLDEAYLDVTANPKGFPSATAIADEIRRRIRCETGLTASAGVSYNKFLAKCASDWQKPDGLTVIRPEDVAGFLARLPVGAFFGVGKATGARFGRLGVRTGADLLGWSLPLLVRHFGGRAGLRFWQLARGIDERPVEPFRERHSLGSEDTFPQDVLDLEWLSGYVRRLSEKVFREAQDVGFEGRTAVLKVKYADFRQVTRSRTLQEAPRDGQMLARALLPLLSLTEAGRVPVRLLGVTLVRTSHGGHGEQLELPLDLAVAS